VISSSRRPLVLFDAHHLGRGQTGNETWTRNMAIAMTDLGATDRLAFAVTSEGLDVLRRFSDAPAYVVSPNSGRRLTVDMPKLIRRTACRATLLTYTAPLSTCPAVVAVHDISPWYPEAKAWMPPTTRTRHRLTVGVSAHVARRLIVPSIATRDDMATRLRVPQARLCVAPCGVDIELGQLMQAAARRERDDRFVVLAVGTIVPRKNLVMLSRAVRASRDQGVPAQLRIVGPVRPPGEVITEEIRGILGPAVDIVGYVSTADLAGEYRSADVVCFPSVVEGFGMPIIEAMAAGVPVMVSDAAASVEVAGAAGLVSDPHAPDAWCRGLVALWSDPIRRETMGREGRRRAAEFSWHRSASIVLEAIEAVARP
jgi:glycosyltransferase involved in cell wall biosynthesis